MVKAQPMLRFQLREQLPAHLIFVAANIGIIVILMIVAQFMTGDDVTGSYTSIGLSAGIYMSIIASTALRSTFRLGAQLGTSRNRCFLDFVLFSIITCYHFYQNVSLCRLVFCPLSQ